MSIQLLTKPEVAAAVRVTTRSLDNWWRDGDGPPRTRIGGRVLVREDHLSAWLDSHAEAPAGAAPDHSETSG
jgi:predicted DNA-binding transcriptional regulator AlpA